MGIAEFKGRREKGEFRIKSGFSAGNQGATPRTFAALREGRRVNKVAEASSTLWCEREKRVKVL
jgi:hypothetical protein